LRTRPMSPSATSAWTSICDRSPVSVNSGCPAGGPTSWPRSTLRSRTRYERGPAPGEPFSASGSVGTRISVRSSSRFASSRAVVQAGQHLALGHLVVDLAEDLDDGAGDGAGDDDDLAELHHAVGADGVQQVAADDLGVGEGLLGDVRGAGSVEPVGEAD